MTNNFSKLFTLAIAGLALTMAGQVQAEEPAVAAGPAASADNTEDSLVVKASIEQYLALEIKTNNLTGAGTGVTRDVNDSSVNFSHNNSAKELLPTTEIGKIHLISNNYAGYEVFGCSDNGSKLNHTSSTSSNGSSSNETTSAGLEPHLASSTSDGSTSDGSTTDGSTSDGSTTVDYEIQLSGGGNGNVTEGSITLSACSNKVDTDESTLLINGEGIGYENSIDTTIGTASNSTNPYTMSISWSADVTRVSGAYEDTIRVKIFGL